MWDFAFKDSNKISESDKLISETRYPSSQSPRQDFYLRGKNCTKNYYFEVRADSLEEAINRMQKANSHLEYFPTTKSQFNRCK